MTEAKSPSPVPHPFADLLGFEVVSRGDGRSRLEMEVRPQHSNPHGLVHGGVLYALADTGMGAALAGELAQNEICTTIEIKINYLRPWREGNLRCETRLVSQGRTTALLQSDLYDGACRHLAMATGTFAVLPRPGT